MRQSGERLHTELGTESGDIRYVFRLENLLNIVESDKALINSCYDILSTPKVFDHLG